MITVSMNLWEQGATSSSLDVAEVKRRLVERFPGISIDEQDRLREQVERARAIFQEPTKAEAKVIEKMCRDAERLGPAHGFRFTSSSGEPIQGYVRRYSLCFMSDADVPESTTKQLVSFLESVAPSGSGARVEVRQ